MVYEDLSIDFGRINKHPKSRYGVQTRLRALLEPAVKKNFTVPVLNYRPLIKAAINGVLAGHTVAMVTYFVMERTITCSPITGECLDTMIVASSDKEWLQ